jgi:Arc/MetJ-type ribon-helix-helix transcriptional regulator
MKKSIKVNQKQRGRPATGRDPVSAVRLPVDLTAAVDRWGEDHEFSSRSEAIRRLVEIGLSAQTSERPKVSSGAVRAAELAASVIEKHIDSSAPAEEREIRKRRLLKGPSAFRDVRVDRTKKEKSAPAGKTGLKAKAK